MTDRRRNPREEPDDAPGEPDATADSQHGVPADVRRTPATQQIGRVVVLVLLVLFAVFAISNSQRVDFSWVAGSTEVTEQPGTDETAGGVPLILLLVASFVIGALSGAMAVRIVQRRRARDASPGER